jgi:hypothetical protein
MMWVVWMWVVVSMAEIVVSQGAIWFPIRANNRDRRGAIRVGDTCTWTRVIWRLVKVFCTSFSGFDYSRTAFYFWGCRRRRRDGGRIALILG